MFCQFQSGFAYKSVAYERKRVFHILCLSKKGLEVLCQCAQFHDSEMKPEDIKFTGRYNNTSICEIPII